jgi:Amt family ammonium transporter
VHMVCGIWGTLSLGLFATGQYGLPTPIGVDVTSTVRGLFYRGGLTQLGVQALGSASVTVATLAAAFVLMYAVKATGTLRVSREGEIEGLDLHEHGMLAYPEFPSYGSPTLTHIPSHATAAAPPVLHPSRSEA